MTPTLTEVSGIGPSMAETLVANNIDSVGKLAEIEIEKLTAVPGIGEITGEAMIRSAAELIARGQPPKQKKTKEGQKNKKGKKDKKEKKRKKDKKKKDKKKK